MSKVAIDPTEQAVDPSPGRPAMVWLLLLYAVVMRFAELGQESFSVDEGMSMLVSTFWQHVEQWDVHPPGFFALLELWKLGGNSEFWLRSLPALCSLISLGLMSRLGVSRGPGPSENSSALSGVRVSALFLFAGLTYNLEYARELRMYPLLGMWVLLGMLSVQRRWFWLYGICLSLALWTHFFGIWLAVLTVPLVWSLTRREQLHWLIATVVGGLSFVPWVLRLQSVIGKADLGLRSPPDLSDLPELLGRILVGDFLAKGVWWLALLGGFLGLALTWLALRKNDSEKVELFWWVWALLPPLLTWLVSRYTAISVFEYKYLVWTVPAWCVLLDRLLGPKGVAVLLLINLATFVGTWGGNQDWRGTAMAIRAKARPGDFIVVNPSMMAAPLLYYGFPPQSMQPVDTPEQLVGLSGRVWLISTPHHPLAIRGNIAGQLASRGRCVWQSETHPVLPSAVVRISLWELP